MIILSCRKQISLPDASTSWLGTGGFAEAMGYSRIPWDWGSCDPWPEEPTKKLFVIHSGFNCDLDGWKDAATDAAMSISATMRAYGITGWTPVCGLWPGESTPLRFSDARAAAVRAASGYYAPLYDRLLAAGYKIAVMGHSAGGWLAYNEARELWGNQRSLSAVFLVNAAMRQSEFEHTALFGAKHWINFYSRKDAALHSMQIDPVDERGGWKGFFGSMLKGRFFRSGHLGEPLVGMHGIGFSDPSITEVDMTHVIGSRHSDARYVPGFWKVVKTHLERLEKE